MLEFASISVNDGRLILCIISVNKDELDKLISTTSFIVSEEDFFQMNRTFHVLGCSELLLLNHSSINANYIRHLVTD